MGSCNSNSHQHPNQQAAIREGKIESTRAPAAVIQQGADATSYSTPPPPPAASDIGNNNGKNKAARALRGKGTEEQQPQQRGESGSGSGVVEQEIEAVPRLD